MTTLLSGDKVELRSLEEDDLKDFFIIWNDPEFWGDYGGFVLKSWHEFEEFVKSASFFIIEKKEDGIASGKIGWIAFFLAHTDYPYLYEIAYAIRPSERRKGYTTEATKLIVNFLFMTRNIERIESVIDAENIPSRRVLEKNGFKREGTLRKRTFGLGEYRDEFIYSILREEWSR